MKNNSELFPGWILHYKKVSNNVYQFELKDKFGHLSGCTDYDFERGIETCVSYAFDIGKQLTINWNKFLFDIYKFELSKYKLRGETYHEKDFNSWAITFEKCRVILNGKDVLIYQYQDKKRNWIDKNQVKLVNITYDKIKLMATLVAEESGIINNGNPGVERTWFKKILNSFVNA